MTTVVSASKRYAPLTVTHRIKGRRGAVVQSVGLGPRPYKLLVSGYSSAGTRSRTVAYKIP